MSDAPLPLYGEDRTSFFMAVSPFFGVSAEVAAQMAYQHMAHHLRVGFRWAHSEAAQVADDRCASIALTWASCVHGCAPVRKRTARDDEHVS